MVHESTTLEQKHAILFLECKSCMSLVLTNLYIMSYLCCRLEDEIDRIVDKAGGSRKIQLHFTESIGSCTLVLSKDIEPLFDPEGWVSAAFLDWFRVWCQVNYASKEYLFCSPFLFGSLNTHVLKFKESYDSMEAFVSKHLKEPVPLQAIIVPVLEKDHWSLVIMTKSWKLFHFDSLHTSELHGHSHIYRLLGKMWAAKLGVGQHDKKFAYVADRRNWKVPTVPT